ncbi:VAMP-associated protein [Suhomyces tanzawaensis NRRL Y-17324]|uniref:VAMP-associated protein n=1 Tax=Suhomyces tanzawaensis NRRL Y-17324 TaxID=984487 RepID=A0A1E4SR26_9ASCO|nr:VAMP-associated protein [Suhomyces tanzawaensis NRRL Y-17324]ODV81948.1 VAMP-associated protein [Suhomyces tanzawaensis NRRL Y-17324]
MEVSPSTLEFRGTFTKQTTEYLKLTNTAKSPLAFKVKTTAPKLYSVRPNASIVQPGESIDISINLQGFSQPLPKDYKCKDKFLLVSLPCPELSDVSKVGEVWSELEAKYKPQVVSKKLRVNYVITDSDDSSASHTTNGNGLSEGDITHINQTVINDASTAQATPIKQSNGIAASGASRLRQEDYDTTHDRTIQGIDATPRAVPPSPPTAQAPPVPQVHQAPAHTEKFDEKAPVHTTTTTSSSQVAASEPANTISIQLAAVLVILAFLLGWLIF